MKIIVAFLLAISSVGVLAAGSVQDRSKKPASTFLSGVLTDEQGKPLPRIRVRINEVSEARTLDRGEFRIGLPANVRPGDTVQIALRSSKWVLKTVEHGENLSYGFITLPNENKVLRLIAVPLDALSLLTDEQIRKRLVLTPQGTLKQRSPIGVFLEQLQRRSALDSEAKQRDAEAHFRAAELDLAQSRFDAAIINYRYSTTAVPTAAAYLNLAYCYEILGKIGDAETEYLNGLRESENAHDQLFEISFQTSLARTYAFYGNPKKSLFYANAAADALTSHLKTETHAAKSGHRVETDRSISNALRQGLVYMAMSAAYKASCMYSKSKSYLSLAQQVYQGAKFALGEADALMELGAINADHGEFPDAIQNFQDAADIFRRENKPLGEARALRNLSVQYRQTGKFGEKESTDQKVNKLKESFPEIRADADDARIHLDNGNSYLLAGKPGDAVTEFEAARKGYHIIGDRIREGKAVGGSALAYRRLATKEKPEYLQHAIDAYKEARIIFQDSSDCDDEGLTLHNLGALYLNQKDLDSALSTFKDALRISTQADNGLVMESANLNIGEIYKIRGQDENAIAAYEAARSFYERVGFKEGYATAMLNLGRIDLFNKRNTAAIQKFVEARQAYKEAHRIPGEATALGYIGVAKNETGDKEEAILSLNEACKMLKSVPEKVPDVSIFRETLKDLNASPEVCP